MRFSSFVFSLGLPVQPVTVRVRAPLPVHLDTARSSLLTNLLWMMFQPGHRFELALLPVESHSDDSLEAAVDAEAPLDAHAFADRVANRICERLGVPATAHSTRDKAAYLKAVKAAAERSKCIPNGAPCPVRVLSKCYESK